MTFRIAPTYDEVGCFLDRKFNYPEFSASFTEEDFRREYDSAFDILAEELCSVGAVSTDGFGNGDFSMYRYVDLNRSITVVTYGDIATSPGAVSASYAVLQRLPEEYVISFDAHPTYVCVRRDGTVIGHATDGSTKTLRKFGFPV